MLSSLKKKEKDVKVYSPVNGKSIALEDVQDTVFAEKLLGDGVAVVPEEGSICSPCDGEISMVADTRHAFGIVAYNGAELLVHVGLDTVELKGEGFEVCVKEGQKVKVHDPVLKVDLEFMRTKGIDMTIPIVVTNSSDYELEKSQEQLITIESQMMLIRKK